MRLALASTSLCFQKVVPTHVWTSIGYSVMCSSDSTRPGGSNICAQISVDGNKKTRHTGLRLSLLSHNFATQTGHECWTVKPKQIRPKSSKTYYIQIRVLFHGSFFWALLSSLTLTSNLHCPPSQYLQPEGKISDEQILTRGQHSSIYYHNPFLLPFLPSHNLS